MIKCPECGCEHFTLGMSKYALYMFANCDFCEYVYMFSLDWIHPTEDNEYLKRKAILFRRFK